MTLLALIRVRLQIWLGRYLLDTAIRRMERARPHRQEPRSLPPFIAA